MNGHAAPLLLPRGLIFLASIWLIGSWLITIGIRSPVQPSAASYTPGVRLMLMSIMTGLMIAWPLLRISQDRPAKPLSQTLLDLTVLLGLVQVVIWPLRLVTSWTPARLAAIDASIVGWTVLVGAIVAAAGLSARMGPRCLAIGACLAMCFLSPALAWSGSLLGLELFSLSELSPLIDMRRLSDAGATQPASEEWRRIWWLAAAGLAAWACLGLSTTLIRPAYRHDHPNPGDLRPIDQRH